ncbi:MAG: hypothetical protein CL609_13420 [Anaerolineaceae bacterium]|nr:hypothetical protein [Anaerolineaceae bacterium]
MQLGGKLSYFANRSRNSKQPFLLGMEGPRKGEEHHFISNKGDYWPKVFREITDKYKLDLNGDWNKRFLEGHNGRHTNAYHRWVLEKLKEIDISANGNVIEFLKQFEENIKKPVMRNPRLPYK